MPGDDSINLEVWDATGNKKVIVNLPTDSPVNRIIVLLVEKMNLPRNSPDGQLMSYKFHHKASSRQLLDEETFGDAGVREGDVLRLQPEITAGCNHMKGCLLPVIIAGGVTRGGSREQCSSRGAGSPQEVLEGRGDGPGRRDP